MERTEMIPISQYAKMWWERVVGTAVEAIYINLRYLRDILYYSMAFRISVYERNV